MGVRRASHEAGKQGGGKALATVRWLAVALAMATLAACQTGTLSYNQSTGAFELPFGSGSRSVGSNK